MSDALGDPSSPGLRPGEAVGPFVLAQELGRGGMGVVHLARDPATGRDVALKVLLGARVASPIARERFLREGQIAASLDHPGIVRVHAAGHHGTIPYLACELVQGARPLTAAAAGRAPLERARLVRDLVNLARERGRRR